VTVRVHARYAEDVTDSAFGITVRNKSGLDIFSTDTRLEKTPIKSHKSGDRIIVDFGFRVLLRRGPYSVAAFVSRGQDRKAYLDWIDVSTVFEVSRPTDRGAIVGMVHLPTKVTVFEPKGARNPKRSA